jgi:hypothetical protein
MHPFICDPGAELSLLDVQCLFIAGQGAAASVSRCWSEFVSLAGQMSLPQLSELVCISARLNSACCSIISGRPNQLCLPAWTPCLTGQVLDLGGAAAAGAAAAVHCGSSFDNAEVYAKGQAEEIMGKAFKVRAARASRILTS